MPTQPPLFDDIDTPAQPATRSLTFTPGPGRPLTTAQKTFNRLVTKVERLRAQVTSDRDRLEAALIFHAAEIRPRLMRVVALKTEHLIGAQPFLADRRIKGPDRRILVGILTELLEDLLALDPNPTPEIRELFEQLHGLSFDEAIAEDMDIMRDEMTEMFGSMGLDLDLSGFQPGMSDEEMAAQAARMADQVRSQLPPEASGVPPGQRPSQRAAKAAEHQRRVDEARKTSLSSIYRRLAKVMHPDLERDPVVRERKSAQMQELTQAHKRQDLHALLTLELEWIQQAGDDAHRLADDTLAIYNDALKQQLDELQTERYILPEHPKYLDVVHNAGFGPPAIIDGPARVSQLDALITHMSDLVGRMRSGNGFVDIQEMIQFRRRPRKTQQRRKPRRRK